MSIKGLLFYSFITIILAICFINSKNYVILASELLILFIVLKKYNLQMVIIQILLFSFFCFYKTNIQEKILETDVKQEFVVKEAKESYLIVKAEKQNYLVYLDNQENTYSKNDLLEIEGTIKEIDNNLDYNVFDFKEYLKNKRIYYEIKPSNLELISKNESYSTKIINYLTKKLEDESFAMTKMLLFNDKHADIENYENLKQINALHLFVVSGFHISFFFNMIMILFKKIKTIGLVIASLICLFYIYVLDFSISATRALITLVSFKLLNKYLNRLDCIAIPGIVFLLIEPLNVYNYSFILSFLMVIVIAFSSEFLNKINKVLQILLLSLLCFLAMVPFQLVFNYKINFISLFSNILLSYLVMGIFVLNIIGIILSSINGNIFKAVYVSFNDLVGKIANLNTSLTFGKISFSLIIFYYLILAFLLYKLAKKKTPGIILAFSFVGSFVFGLYNRLYLTPYQQVTFLNVYQGDCCIIQDSFSNKVMLIDTGGLINYDIASKKIMPYLESKGIRKINKVVISHDDYDHCGALEKLQELIQIDEIIKDNSIKGVNLGKISLENVNTYFEENSSENDKSIVLYGKICSINYLFAGDISATIEKQLVNGNNFDVDVLKVAHHGSKTSSCKEFIENTNPSYGIISVGKNYYGHPNKEVLARFKENDTVIYQTNIEGTIIFKGQIFNYVFVEGANLSLQKLSIKERENIV